MSLIANLTNITLTANLNVTDDSEHIDINKKYYLNIIVPILWSLIIIFGILGRNKVETDKIS